MPGKDTATTRNSNVEQLRPFEKFKNELSMLAEAAVSEMDGKAITVNVVEAMIEADSLEAAIAVQDQGILNGKDMVNIEQEIREFTIVESDDKYDSALGVYVRVENAVRLDTAEPVVWATGASNVVTLLRKAQRSGRLPLQCVLRARETKNGDLLTLHLIAPRPIPGEVVA